MKKFSARPLTELWGSFLISSCLHALILGLAVMSRPETPRLNLDMPTINLSRVTIGSNAPRPKEIPREIPEETPELSPAPEVVPEELLLPIPVPVPEKTIVENQPAPQPPSDEELLREAFAEARRSATPRPAVSGGRSVLDQALAEALAEAKKEGDGGTVSGKRGDGIGYYGLYLESVISRIKPHFTTRPRSDDKIFEMTIRLEIAEDGSISKITVLTPSGDDAFDSHVIRAVREAGKMEPPLSQDVRSLEITFNSQMSAGPTGR